MPNNFARDKGLGKWGEKQVIKHLEAKGHTISDVSEDEKWQKKGIDVIITPKPGATYTADIKMDRMIHLTNNLFIETKSSIKVMGNMITSSADYFLYLDPYNCKLYTIDRRKMLEFWEENQEVIIVKTVGNKDRLTQGFLMTTEAIVEFGLAAVEDIYIEGSFKNKEILPI